MTRKGMAKNMCSLSFGKSIFADISTRPKAIIELEKYPHFCRCCLISAQSSGDTGMERFFPLLVFCEGQLAILQLIKRKLLCSPHRAPVARLILVTSLTCGFKENLSIVLSKALIYSVVNQDNSRSSSFIIFTPSSGFA